MPLTELKRPAKAYRNMLAQVSVETGISGATRIEFTGSGAISHYEARMGYPG